MRLQALLTVVFLFLEFGVRIPPVRFVPHEIRQRVTSATTATAAAAEEAFDAGTNLPPELLSTFRKYLDRVTGEKGLQQVQEGSITNPLVDTSRPEWQLFRLLMAGVWTWGVLFPTATVLWYRYLGHCYGVR